MEQVTTPITKEQWDKANYILDNISKAFACAHDCNFSMTLVLDDSKTKYAIKIDEADGNPDIVGITPPESLEDILLEGIAVIEDISDKQFLIM
jgi:hypothetical protein